MTCPSCGIENVPSADYCDCGHEFVTGSKPTDWTPTKVPGLWKRFIGSSIVLYFGIAFILGGLRPPIVPEFVADGLAIILASLAYRSRKRTLLGSRRYSPLRRRLEFAAVGIAVVELMFRPGSERYHYDIAFNLAVSISAVCAYGWLVRKQGTT
jgi:hypothetical protein